MRKSTILTFVSAIGVIGTAVIAARETPKALRLINKAEMKKEAALTRMELVCAAGPAYIPVVAIGITTITCMFGANVLNRKQQASIVSAYALLNARYRKYRETLVCLHGNEADKEVLSAMAREHYDHHITDMSIPDQKVVFYDDISGNSFEAYERDVIDAEYHINRNFVLRGYVSLNEFYQFLGLPETEYGETVGWCSADGYSWIDFQHKLVSRDDGGMDIYSIEMMYEPDLDYMREWR